MTSLASKNPESELALGCVPGTWPWMRLAPLTSSKSAWGHRARTPWGRGAAQRFLARCRALGLFGRIVRARVDLFGSLAKTGKGHGTDIAVMLGLSDDDPVTCDPAQIHPRVASIRSAGTLALGGEKPVPLEPAHDLVFHSSLSLPFLILCAQPHKVCNVV
jgi:hypothetical protein